MATTLEDLAFQAEQEIGRTKAFFPILSRLGNTWAATRPFSGLTIGLNVHLTTVMAAFIKELSLGGARCVVSAANPGTTDPGTVQLLRNSGFEVYTGGDRKGDRHLQLLAHQPALLVDASFDLLDKALHQTRDTPLLGAVLTSRTAVARLSDHGEIPFPVVNLTEGRLHDAVENRHGIGEAVWQAVASLTGMYLAGRRAAVAGYGPVGRALAAWARHAGMAVEVVETDAVRRLFAHYDGFATPSLADALQRANVLVTATGRPGVVGLANLSHARPGIVLLNAGTGGDEIDVQGLRTAADFVDHIGDGVVRYGFDSGTSVTILGDGHPLNIVLNSGSPEPVLLECAVVGICLDWLVQHTPPPGAVVVPREVEAAAAELALSVLDRPTR